MAKKCLKCGYERRDTDTAPDYECPQCGAIYAKVEARLAQAQPQQGAPAQTSGKRFAENSVANRQLNKIHDFLEKRHSNAEIAKQLELQGEVNLITNAVSWSAADIANLRKNFESKAVPAQPRKKSNLIKCKDCGEQISKKAKACPKCGAPVKQQTSFLTWAVSFLILLGLMASLVSSPELDKKTVADNTPAPPPKREPAPRITKTPEQLEAEAAERAARRAAEEAACKKELQCWGDRKTAAAGIYCKDKVERLAKYSFEWTDGWLEPKFSRFRWKDQQRGYVTFIGDKIRLQNGFGAWQNYTYECDLDTEHDRVIDVRARPGRL